MDALYMNFTSRSWIKFKSPSHVLKMAGGRIWAILGYCPGKVGFGGIREPARRKLRNCVQISMPCGFKAERLCGAAA